MGDRGGGGQRVRGRVQVGADLPQSELVDGEDRHGPVRPRGEKERVIGAIDKEQVFFFNCFFLNRGRGGAEGRKC